MALTVEVNSFVQTDGGVNGTTQDVTVGFDPKALIIFHSQGITTEAIANGTYRQLIGFVDDANTNLAVIAGTVDAAGTTDTMRYFHTTSSILGVASTGATLTFRGTIAMGTAKFTITWNLASGGTHLISYIAFGGTDITGVDVGTFTEKTTNGDDTITVDADCQSITNGQGALFLISHNTTTTGSGLGNTAITFGFESHGGTDKGHCIAYLSDDAEATSECYNVLQTTRIIDLKSPIDGTNFGDAYLKEFNATGFTLTWANVDASARTIGFLIIKGGQWQAGNETTRTTTGTKATTTNFAPLGLLLGTVLRTATGSAKQDSSFSIGASDETRDEGRGGCEDDALGTSNTGRSGSTTELMQIQSPTANTTTLVESRIETGGSFNATDFTLDYTTVDGSAYIFIWMVCGNNAVVGGFVNSRGYIIG